MLTIDGSFLEGGGQILRTSLALSTLLQEPCKIINIRSGRDNPGLRAQHLMCIRALKSICGARALGDELGSNEITFVPSPVKSGRYEFDIGTAGSVTLVLQSLMIPLMFADETITVVLRGGTNVKGAMPVEYLQDVLLPQLSKFCERIECKLIKRGYYPVGKGEIEFTVTPIVNRNAFDKFDDFLSTLRAVGQKINLVETGRIDHITGVSHASNHLSVRRVAERQSSAAELALKSLKLPVNIKCEYALSESVGSGISLFAHYVNSKDEIDPAQPVVIGVDMLGEQRIEAEDVGRKCAEKLIAEISLNAPVDMHLADNLVPFIGLYGGCFKTSSISSHTKTNMYVVEKFLPVKFMVKNNIITTMQA